MQSNEQEKQTHQDDFTNVRHNKKLKRLNRVNNPLIWEIKGLRILLFTYDNDTYEIGCSVSTQPSRGWGRHDIVAQHEAKVVLATSLQESFDNKEPFYFLCHAIPKPTPNNKTTAESIFISWTTTTGQELELMVEHPSQGIFKWILPRKSDIDSLEIYALWESVYNSRKERSERLEKKSSETQVPVVQENNNELKTQNKKAQVGTSFADINDRVHVPKKNTSFRRSPGAKPLKSPITRIFDRQPLKPKMTRLSPSLFSTEYAMSKNNNKFNEEQVKLNIDRILISPTEEERQIFTREPPTTFFVCVKMNPQDVQGLCQKKVWDFVKLQSKEIPEATYNAFYSIGMDADVDVERPASPSPPDAFVFVDQTKTVSDIRLSTKKTTAQPRPIRSMRRQQLKRPQADVAQTTAVPQSTAVTQSTTSDNKSDQINDTDQKSILTIFSTIGELHQAGPSLGGLGQLKSPKRIPRTVCSARDGKPLLLSRKRNAISTPLEFDSYARKDQICGPEISTATETVSANEKKHEKDGKDDDVHKLFQHHFASVGDTLALTSEFQVSSKINANIHTSSFQTKVSLQQWMCIFVDVEPNIILQFGQRCPRNEFALNELFYKEDGLMLVDKLLHTLKLNNQLKHWNRWFLRRNYTNQQTIDFGRKSKVTSRVCAMANEFQLTQENIVSIWEKVEFYKMYSSDGLMFPVDGVVGMDHHSQGCVGLWPLGSFIRHSCDPNCFYIIEPADEDDVKSTTAAGTSTKPKINLMFKLYALRDIPPNTELTVNYFNGHRSAFRILESRNRYAHSRFGTHCECCRCELEKSIGCGSSSSIDLNTININDINIIKKQLQLLKQCTNEYNRWDQKQNMQSKFEFFCTKSDVTEFLSYQNALDIFQHYLMVGFEGVHVLIATWKKQQLFTKMFQRMTSTMQASVFRQDVETYFLLAQVYYLLLKDSSRLQVEFPCTFNNDTSTINVFDVSKQFPDATHYLQNLLCDNGGNSSTGVALKTIQVQTEIFRQVNEFLAKTNIKKAPIALCLNSMCYFSTGTMKTKTVQILMAEEPRPTIPPFNTN